MDGYDKLKPFGLAINGCIDGYSRYLLWVEVSYTNNDPTVIAGYFLDAVMKRGGTPRTVRMDPGTENVHVDTFQRFLCEDNGCVIIGSSTTNERIEAWWGQLRKQKTEYYIMELRKLQAAGLFSGDHVDKDLVRLCFIGVLQVSVNY